MLAGIVVVAIGLIAFGLLADYTRRAVVYGFLQPDAGILSITATRPGQLFVEVPNGAYVSSGDKIARIVGYDVDASGKSLLELEIRGLEEAKALIWERLELAESRNEPMALQENLALEQHAREIIAAEALTSTQFEQLDLAKETAARNQTLSEKGLISSAALQEALSGLIAAEQALSDAEAQLATLQAQTEQLKIDWRLREVELRQNINVLEREFRSMEGQLIQARARGESGLFAPVDGTITYSSAQNGEAVNVGTKLFQITPNDTELRAVLLAPSSAVGFVTVGDVVQIRYAAFPFREHGVFQGIVREIDDAAQLSSAIRAPISVSEPIYRVVVEVDQSPDSKAGDKLRLAPGMTLEASIIIDQKPLLLWLLDPLL